MYTNYFQIAIYLTVYTHGCIRVDIYNIWHKCTYGKQNGNTSIQQLVFALGGRRLSRPCLQIQHFHARQQFHIGRGKNAKHSDGNTCEMVDNIEMGGGREEREREREQSLIFLWLAQRLQESNSTGPTIQRDQGSNLGQTDGRPKGIFKYTFTLQPSE